MRRELAVASLFVVLAIAMTWPLATHLTTAGGGDPYVATWVLDWDWYATTHRLPLFDANIFSPARLTLAFSENTYGLALLTFPLFFLGLAPLTIHNIALLAGFAACGYAMYALARHVTSSTAAAMISGIAFAFVGMRFHHLGHLPYVWSAWLPLILLAVLQLLEIPSWRNALLLAAALVMNGLTSLHWLVFGTTAAAATLLLLGLQQHGVGGRRFWAQAALAFCIAAIVLAPFLLPYARVAKMYGMHREYVDALPTSARWRDWLAPNLQSKLYGAASAGDAYGHERTLFPGLITFVLAGVALFADVRRAGLIDWIIVAAVASAAIAAVTGHGVTVPVIIATACLAYRLVISGISWRRNAFADRAVAAGALWLFIGAWGARGLYGSLHTFLYRYVSAFRGIRMPARWVFVAYVGLDLLVAIGMKRLLERHSRKAGVLITAAIAAALLFELRAAPLRFFLRPTEKRPVYTWLANTALHGSVVELPMTQDDAYAYMWHATEHHKPLMNGVSSYAPPHYERLQTAYDATPISDDFLEQLAQLHCSLIVVHGDELAVRSDAVRAWLQQNLSLGRIAFVRHFDGRTRGDYVFALPRNEPEYARLREPERPDLSGRTPQQTLAAFLAGETTYVAQPFQHTDIGPAIGTMRGKLTVSGWAFAPAGVRDVNLLFGNGRVVVAADRVMRDDVKAQLPWYPNDPLPGFHKSFAAPPSGIRGETDMQVEVIDSTGTRVRGLPFLFRWLPPAKTRIVWDEPAVTELLERLGSNDMSNRQRLFSGSAAIHDFTPVLLRDSEIETDSAFVDRVLNTILGTADRHFVSRLLAMLTTGTPRERVIATILQSPQFRAKYVKQGEVMID